MCVCMSSAPLVNSTQNWQFVLCTRYAVYDFIVCFCFVVVVIIAISLCLHFEFNDGTQPAKFVTQVKKKNVSNGVAYFKAFEEGNGNAGVI